MEELYDIVWAYALKNAISNNGVPNREKIYRSIIGHLKRNGQVDLANQLIQEMSS